MNLWREVRNIRHCTSLCTMYNVFVENTGYETVDIIAKKSY